MPVTIDLSDKFTPSDSEQATLTTEQAMAGPCATEVTHTKESAENGEWANNFTGELNFLCDWGSAIVAMHSDYSQEYMDRRWKIKCSPVIGATLEDCVWGTTTPDQEWALPVINTGVIVGMEGKFNPATDDRLYNFRFCQLGGVAPATVAPGWTPWLAQDGWNKPMSFSAEANEFISQVGGQFNKHYTDRVFRFHRQEFCMDAAPTPAPTDAADCVDCIVWGDPHIISFDVNRKRKMEHPAKEAFFRSRNWKTDELTVHDEGVFWLVNNAQMKIQARYRHNESNPALTSLYTVAISGPFVGNNLLVIGTLEHSIRWNKQSILESQPSKFHNKWVKADYHNKAELVSSGRKGPGIDMELPNGMTLTVNRWKKSLALKITQCGAPPSAQEGQCGNNNHDLSDDTPQILAQEAPAQVPEVLFKAQKEKARFFEEKVPEILMASPKAQHVSKASKSKKIKKQHSLLQQEKNIGKPRKFKKHGMHH